MSRSTSRCSRPVGRCGVVVVDREGARTAARGGRGSGSTSRNAARTAWRARGSASQRAVRWRCPRRPPTGRGRRPRRRSPRRRRWAARRSPPSRPPAATGPHRGAGCPRPASSSSTEQRLPGISSSRAVATASAPPAATRPTPISSSTVGLAVPAGRGCRRGSVRHAAGESAIRAPAGSRRRGRSAGPRRSRRVGLQLAPQPVDVLGDGGLALPARRAAPHVLQQLRAAEHLAGVAGEEREQVELAAVSSTARPSTVTSRVARVDDEPVRPSAAGAGPTARRGAAPTAPGPPARRGRTA